MNTSDTFDVSSPIRTRLGTQAQQGSKERFAKRARDNSLFIQPDKDSEPDEYNTAIVSIESNLPTILQLSRTQYIDLNVLNEKLLALGTNDSNKGDNIPVNKCSLASLQELQVIADY